jgi:hypothetical protein
VAEPDQLALHPPVPVGAENGVTSCDLRIFMDQATEPITAQNPDVGIRSRRNRMPGRRPLLQRPMRPMRVVMIDVLAEDQPQVPLVGDQRPVQALAAGAGDPPFGDRVRTRRPDRCPDDPHRGRGEHGVERRSELVSRSLIRNLRPSA